MRICIIAEGSYPYVTGGVSSWIHNLALQMPEHEFVIYAIGAQSKQRGQFKYTLPPNIIEVKETFLDEYLDEEGVWGKTFHIRNNQKKNIQALLGSDDEVHWNQLFELLRSSKYRIAADFLSSKDFFDLLEELCRNHYSLVPFTEMFWTVRSMILPLFLGIRNDIPKADLYHSVSTGYAGVVGALAKHLHGSPLLLTEHGIYTREREEEIIKAEWVKGYFKDLWIQYFYRLSTCAYQAADQVTTLFHHNKEIQIELGCNESKITIIPNGVHTDEYIDLPVAPQDDIIRIGAVVRVVPIKDIKTMLQSFAVIKREVPNTEFYIMGPYEEDEQYYEECQQLAAALELSDVTFTGSVRVKDYLGKMDMLMLTSISEGQPLAILEGMASSKPFVATNVGSCKELLYGLDDGIGAAGLIVPVMHYEQIAQAAIQLCRDQKLREEMGRNAFIRVEKHYRQQDVIAGYRKLYESLGGVPQWQGLVSS
ncbi:GT4 family glycosyltransferase PelF [Brevibacillus invocatus]|uniref:GT4 family glycosyltransferase PelF n=1 Tax=Brevibacillus invocatus TaxID=173959 RepID=UPI00203B2D02|nr:GT4 family glycosyltransferase PelF [Brevibacillus invocatus]MCM3077733.1 GT4 family glycosyltransferase PelF [Brevibacillus invocatus]MCM3428734.1 GT4 family glycosyltransferase PelF [Brevibacillus invocatus]